MAIFNAQFDSVTKKFSVSKDGVDLPDIRYFSICKYGEEACMSMEQSITVKTPEDGMVEEVRIWSTAEEGSNRLRDIPGMAMRRAIATNIDNTSISFDKIQGGNEFRKIFENGFANIGE